MNRIKTFFSTWLPKAITYILFVGFAIVIAILLVARLILVTVDLIVLVITLILKLASRLISQIPSWLSVNLVRGWNFLFSAFLPVCEICRFPGFGAIKVVFHECCERHAHDGCHTRDTLRSMERVIPGISERLSEMFKDDQE